MVVLVVVELAWVLIPPTSPCKFYGSDVVFQSSIPNCEAPPSASSCIINYQTVDSDGYSFCGASGGVRCGTSTSTTHFYSHTVCCWFDGGDLVSSQSRFYLVGSSGCPSFGGASGDSRVGVVPSTTLFSSQKVYFGTNARDGGFRRFCNNCAVYPIASSWIKGYEVCAADASLFVGSICDGRGSVFPRTANFYSYKYCWLDGGGFRT